MTTEISDVQRDWFSTDGQAVLGMIGLAPGQRVLDFGAGPGRYSVPASAIVGQREGGLVVSVDCSHKSLEQLQARARQFGRPEAIETLLAENEGCLGDLSVDTVDAVLTFDVLQYVKDWDGFFAAAASMLNPGGCVYVYPAAGPHPDLVDMEGVRASLARAGLVPRGEHRVNVAHAEHMIEDTIFVFALAS